MLKSVSDACCLQRGAVHGVCMEKQFTSVLELQLPGRSIDSNGRLGYTIILDPSLCNVALLIHKEDIVEVGA